VLQEANKVEEIMQYLPFLIPLAVIQMALLAASVVHILRHNNYRFGNRLMWILICVLVNVVGPVLYFAIGKGDE
jgi:hypothetical protein